MFVLATVFEDVGLPDDIIRLFNFDNTDDLSETRMNELYNWPNENEDSKNKSVNLVNYQVLEKNQLNIFHFYQHGTLP